MEPNDLLEQFPLIDAVDHEILMHRDAHFGGLFSIMLDYYRRGGKGVQESFSVERIEQLARLEEQLKQNVAVLFLEANEIEKVADAKEAYKGLRSIYEVKNPKNVYPQLIADLIFSEEEHPEQEIQAIVKEKEKIVPALIEIIKNDQFYDPLFPGYGLVPNLAVECLGLIGDKRAIISLFEAIGQGDFFADDQILKALKQIGEPAKQFLLKVVKGHPINEDNERAAIGLIQFKDDPEVSGECLKLLQDSEVQKDPCLPVYLVLVCAGLKEEGKREEFRQLIQDKHLSNEIKKDMKVIVHDWERE